MTKRLTKIVDDTKNDEGMNVSLSKTFTHHVCIHTRDKVKVSDGEVKAVEKKYKCKCESVHGGLRRREVYRFTDTTTFTTMIQLKKFTKLRKRLTRSVMLTTVK